MEKYSFFNSSNGDRVYSAEDWASFFSTIISTGSVNLPTNLQVLSNGNYTLTVKSGIAYLSGYRYELTTDTVITIDAADGVLDRIDLIKIVKDLTQRKITLQVAKGTPSASAVAPTLTRTSVIEEIAIAEIHVNKSSANINQSMIVDTRSDSSRCGWITSLVDQVNTEDLYLQFEDWYTTKTAEYEEQWNAWFTGQSSQLTNTTYENELADHESRLDTAETGLAGKLNASGGNITGTLSVQNSPVLTQSIYNQSLLGLNANYYLAANNTLYKVPLLLKSTQFGSAFGTMDGSGGWKPNEAGWYQINNYFLYSSSTGAWIQHMLYKNGANITILGYDHAATNTTWHLTGGSVMLYLTPTDTIDVRVSTDRNAGTTGATVNISASDNYTYLRITRIG